MNAKALSEQLANALATLEQVADGVDALPSTTTPEHVVSLLNNVVALAQLVVEESGAEGIYCVSDARLNGLVEKWWSSLSAAELGRG